jgi:hypothetical protein
MNGQGPVDLGADALVALADGAALDEVGVPRVHLAQVGVAARREGTREVERRGRGVVDVDEPLRIVRAGLGGEVEAVDRVAAVGRQGHAVAGLGVARAGLRVLAGQAADLDDGDARRVGQHDRHRQQDPQLVADVLRRHALERLGAVAALQEERFTTGDLGKPVPERVALAGKHERGHLPQRLHRGVAGGLVDVRRLLGRTDRTEVVKAGNAHQPMIRRPARAPPTGRVP